MFGQVKVSAAGEERRRGNVRSVHALRAML